MRFFTSDSHFGHANIIKHCNRPFDDVKSMDEALIKNWNAVVGPDDEVWHLGDVCLDYKLAFKYVSQLNGKKILILGNHDGSGKQMKAHGFHETYQTWTLRLGNHKVFLMHRPKALKGYDVGKWVVHGHTHVNSPKIDLENKMINLSVEWWNYTPVPENELVKIIR
jgi:calcineurin-like phosphoesterase family protein